MSQKDKSSAIEFMKVALLRNDESIRFSESKAGFLFSFSGVIIGLFFNEITLFKSLLFQNNFFGIISIIVLTIIIIGVLVVAFSTFMVIIPRLRVSKVPTLLYFGYIQSISEKELGNIAIKLDSDKALKDLTTQVYVTSTIVAKKYYYVRLEIFGALLIFLGWLISTGLIFYAS